MTSQYLALTLTSVFALTLAACGNPNNSVGTSEVSADTSGCSPLLRRSYEATTAQKFSLSVAFEMPNSPRCWNADRSSVAITYRWTQDSAAPVPNDVGFWLRADGQDLFVKATANCANASSGEPVTCNASAFLSRWVGSLEIAPVRDGVWDTAGIGQNYTFRL
jgi:hypothetical protein